MRSLSGIVCSLLWNLPFLQSDLGDKGKEKLLLFVIANSSDPNALTFWLACLLHVMLADPVIKSQCNLALVVSPVNLFIRLPEGRRQVTLGLGPRW